MSAYAESTRSSRVTSVSRALSLKSRLSAKTPAKLVFQIPRSRKIKDILYGHLQGEKTKDYEQLIVLIRDAEISDDDFQKLLRDTDRCISILGRQLRLFVEALLSLKWTHRNDVIVKHYQSFLVNLLSAHNYHIKFAVDKLILNFIPNDDDPEWVDGNPTAEDRKKCTYVHWTFIVLMKVVPMCQDIIFQSMAQNYPYFKKSSHIHEYYLHNLIWMFDYLPMYRVNILNLIVTNLVMLDINAPKNEIEEAELNDGMEDDTFQFDEDDTSVSYNMRHPVARTLDICLVKVFNYFRMECYNIEIKEIDWMKTKSLYQDMISIFDKIILPTHKLHHVQFLIFNLCCIKTSITEAFLNYLWKKVCTPTIAGTIRSAAVSYIASLVARGSFIPISMLKGTLQQMANWIHVYISGQDLLDCIDYNVKIHVVFYSVCQGLFYIIAFRQKDLINTKKGILFLETLGLQKIVTSRLNPLRVCQPAVVQNFASFTRTYQLAYCYSIMEHNARNVMPVIYQDEKGSEFIADNFLDGFFPFDPYMLKRSGEDIRPFYLNYQEAVDNKSKVDNSAESIDERDDFLCDHLEQPNDSKSFDKMLFGSSPGFKFRNDH